jgi:hypothetical protein
MFRPRILPASARRRAVILVVVLVLLTLFAVVGLAFVLYANAEAEASRVYRESSTFVDNRPDINTDTLGNYAFGLVIFDSADPVSSGATPFPAGGWSAIRGYSLGRDMYGYDADNTASNIYPFNGIGRPHFPFPFPPTFPPGPPVDDHTMLSYVPFISDGFVRDPERLGIRALTVAPTPTAQPYTGGWNSSYTYPDANHVFLGAIDGDGYVLMPSFHRPWIFNPGRPLNDTTNPNWTSPQGKYLTLRPRPVDMSPAFPYPADATGDVKNLQGYPGGNDSIWVDLDFPVQTAPDGFTRFKPLFAFFITDLDGRLNLNVHGNVLGKDPTGNPTHASNQGWGPWEVNPQYVLSAMTGGPPPKAEWPQLFLGSAGAPTVPGRYGPDGQPSKTGSVAMNGKTPHVYGAVDFNGINDTPASAPTGKFSLPGVAPSLPYASFPVFPQGYSNGSAGERTNHPLLYDSQHPGGDDRNFLAPNLTSLLNGGIGSPTALTSELGRLLPTNMANFRTRNLITTDSAAVGRPGLTPWLFDRNGVVVPNAYGYPAGSDPHLPPTGAPVPFPPIGPPGLGLRGGAVPGNSEFRMPGAAAGSAAIDWRAALLDPRDPTLSTVLGKLDLNRFLPPYPHQGSGNNPAPYAPVTNPGGYISAPMFKDTTSPTGPGTRMGPYDRFDDVTMVNYPNINGQFNIATQARQQLADDIYRRLLSVVGVPAVGTPAAPTAAELAPRRWLAQLAVNIVDFIDEDEISTPFNFYNTTDGLPKPNIGDKQTNPTTGMASDPELPKYWVFGTELPKVVINEAMAEYQTAATAGTAFPVKVYVELFNPMPSASQANPPAGPTYPLGVEPQDTVPPTNPLPLYIPAVGAAAAYSPYIVVVADNNVPPAGVTAPPPGTGGLLTPPSFVGPPAGPPLNDVPLGTPNSLRTATDFSNLPAIKTIAGGAAAPVIAPQQFFLVGPGIDAHANISAAPGTTTMLTTSNMSYQVQLPAAATQWQYAAPPGVALPPTCTPPAAGTTIYDGPNPTTSPTAAKTSGITVLLRRLLNPHRPYDPAPTDALGNLNPNYNPYLTVDYMKDVMPQDVTTPATAATRSYSKSEPYASNTSLFVPVTLGAAGTTQATFGTYNTGPVPPPAPYNWLVHLDRQLISPMELLHVSGFQPHDLTQHFLIGPPVGPAGPYGKGLGHRVNWFDETNRLYRAFEFLTTRDRASGVSLHGRLPGMVNINTIYDPETLFALCDPQPGNDFTAAMLMPGAPGSIYDALIARRSPGLAAPPGKRVLGPSPAGPDRPFLGMGTGNMPTAPGDPVSCNDDGSPKASNTGIEDTFLRSFGGGAGGPTAPRLFEVPGAPHPYQSTELMAKIFGNVTTRSNVFAVWCTVGFFQVVDETTRPVKLGAEIGAATGTSIRHQMFAVIDRTKLILPSPAGTPAATPAFVTNTAGPIAGNSTSVSVPVAAVTGTVGGPAPAPTITWTFQKGSVLIIDNGTSSEETVIVEAVGPGSSIQATFEKPHGPGVPISIPGNPGPSAASAFSVRGTTYPGLVPAYDVLK